MLSALGRMSPAQLPRFDIDELTLTLPAKNSIAFWVLWVLLVKMFIFIETERLWLKRTVTKLQLIG